MKIVIAIGTRPDIIKMKPVIKEAQRRRHRVHLIHTGQHHDHNMSQVFVAELKLPKPAYYLGASSRLQGVQTAKVMIKSEKVLKSIDPDILLVLGDTNSALGCTLAASKIDIPIGHVEAGCRSFDKKMAEEINRVVISHLSSIHFAPTENCKTNLWKEGIRENVFLTGHPLVDLIDELKPLLSKQSFNLPKEKFVLATIHRRENILNQRKLRNVLKSLNEVSKEFNVIFPIHPHTRRQIRHYGLTNNLKNITILEPLGYLHSLQLIKRAQFVLTDSGGIQQEAALLKTPSLTLRDRTEWIETVRIGINYLVDAKPATIMNKVKQIIKYKDKINKKYRKNIFGNVGASERIMDSIESFCK